MNYFFINPYDDFPMWFKTLESAELCAKEYLGKEIWDEEVTRIEIFQAVSVKVLESFK